jgi:hypothetical protein
MGLWRDWIVEPSRRPYTPERAYRLSVRPLAILLVVIGIVVLVSVWFMTAVVLAIFRPLLQSQIATELIGSGIGLFLVIDGVGLYMRSKLAWYALMSGLIVAGAGQVIIVFSICPVFSVPVFLIPLNAALWAGLCLATRQVFTGRRAERQLRGKPNDRQ